MGWCELATRSRAVDWIPNVLPILRDNRTWPNLSFDLLEATFDEFASQNGHMRCRKFETTVGQDDLLGPDSPLRTLMERSPFTSLVPWRPSELDGAKANLWRLSECKVTALDGPGPMRT